jgi:hypothetical protein
MTDAEFNRLVSESGWAGEVCADTIHLYRMSIDPEYYTAHTDYG